MVPIGIVTRNRVAYLDVTLRSLSATTLPDRIPLTVFDDSSNSRTSQRYYTTNNRCQIDDHWPTGKMWRETLGLGVINNSALPRGIKGEVQVHKLGKEPLGVVNASCEAIRQLFEANPNAPGVILLQDDVIFKADWYETLCRVAQTPENFGEQQLGLLAGIKLNTKINWPAEPKPVLASGITAQCLYISRAGFEALGETYFKKKHTIQKRFDDTLRRAMDNNKLWAGVIFPFVCQHFGVKSLVRPKKGWHQGAKGRVGFYVHPPYALANAVKRFEE